MKKETKLKKQLRTMHLYSMSSTTILCGVVREQESKFKEHRHKSRLCLSNHHKKTLLLATNAMP